jgi:hypothetical protein
MMSTVASLSLNKKPRFIDPVGKSQTSEGDACQLRDTPTRAPFMMLVDASSTSSNVEPAHSTTKNFAPNLR